MSTYIQCSSVEITQGQLVSFFSAFYVELFTKRLLEVLVRNLNQGAILLSLRNCYSRELGL